MIKMWYPKRVLPSGTTKIMVPKTRLAFEKGQNCGTQNGFSPRKNGFWRRHWMIRKFCLNLMNPPTESFGQLHAIMCNT